MNEAKIHKQNIYLFWFVLLLSCVCVWGNAYKGFFHKCPEPKPPLFIADSNEPALVIEVVLWLQEEVGARPDGVIGPETTRLVNAQSKLDEPIYFNKCASLYFTASGAPRED